MWMRVLTKLELQRRVCVLKMEPHIDIDLCLVEQIKLSPHACTHSSTAECTYVCVCARVFSVSVSVFGDFESPRVCVRAQHGILIPGPNPVILWLSHSFK